MFSSVVAGQCCQYASESRLAKRQLGKTMAYTAPTSSVSMLVHLLWPSGNLERQWHKLNHECQQDKILNHLWQSNSEEPYNGKQLNN
jgi:hypothetical protein